MDRPELLYGTSAGVLSLALFALLLGANELGFRAGRRTRLAAAQADHSQSSALEAAVLGLLALQLAFATSLSAARFDTRRTLIVEEANAIGTAYRRTEVLSSPEREALAGSLRRYVDACIAFYEAGYDAAAIERATRDVDAHQREVWSIATAAARAHRDPVTALVVASINDAFDHHDREVNAFEQHIPDSFVVLLQVSAILSFAVVGYANGLTLRRSEVLVALVAFLAVLTIYIVLDLDRPRRGLIKLSKRSLVVLRANMDHALE